MTRLPALQAAEELLGARFPGCHAAFLAGSVVRGDATPTSDLDIVVVTDHPEAPFRESLYFQGYQSLDNFHYNLKLELVNPPNFHIYLRREHHQMPDTGNMIQELHHFCNFLEKFQPSYNKMLYREFLPNILLHRYLPLLVNMIEHIVQKDQEIN